MGYIIESVKNGVLKKNERTEYNSAINIFNRKVLCGKYSKVDLLEKTENETKIISSYLNNREVK